ncbi:uncharacterized protein LOC124275490 [Haliotis rubra]|uniref:uncharacterized protein LOC124275490 n=1 Tax=Haliotis rubra TaxID=36100 RepID=UPI001EE4F245|nr:uncharacterized protein LOC124275490 [Haliotis rubra]
MIKIMCTQNHTAIGRAADTLTEDTGLHFPGDKMLQGYLHFEAMCDHKYSFTCDICGRFPCCLVTDANRKCAFPLALSQVPGAETASDEINMDVFWNQTVEASLLYRGFGKEAANDGRVSPSYDNWAPFVGLARKDAKAFNTEAEKLRSLTKHLQDGDFDAGDRDLTEDVLMQMLCEKKVPEVRHWCTKMEVDAKGTKLEMINRLKEKLKSKSTFNKLFSGIWGHSGGWVSASCPHRIVYAFKSILRPESVRDHVDLLLSLSRQPPVVISDVAPMMSRHGNRRRKNMFYPNEGRLAEATAENIQKAKDGNFSKSIPYMKEWLTVAPLNALDSDAHFLPSSETFCLLDRFHEGNTKSEQELLRRISLVPEMKGRINSQVEEQMHRKMNRNNYFLDVMSPGNYMFVLRLLLHFYNQQTNKKMTAAVEGQLKNDILCGEIRHDTFGRLHLSGQLECIQEQANSAESTSTKLDVFQDICNDNRQLDDIVVSIGPYRVSKLDILTIAPRLPKETEDQMRDKIEKEMRWTVGWVNDQIINAFLYVLCQGRECKERNVALSTQVIEGWRNFKSGRSHRVALLRKEKLSDAEKVFIPIHRQGSHWTLLVLDVQTKQMRFYDPMNRTFDEEVVNITREYMEYRLQNVPDDAIDPTHFNVEVGHGYTTQKDTISCGVYVCIL